MMYEIQCPNCSRALVIPAHTPEELQEYWQHHQNSGLDFYCPACQSPFKGLCQKMTHPEKQWPVIVDINGSRFNYHSERLDRLFKNLKEPGYL